MIDRHHQPVPSESNRSHLRVVRGVDAVHDDGVLQTAELGPMQLEYGGALPNVTLAYRTWGTLNESADNAIFILHALTGDSLCAGPGGWWEPVIGEGQPIDPATSFVVCANVLGGCSGSTGPASINPETGKPWALQFPLVTIGDIVAAQRRLVDHLGIRRLLVIGGSIGGFQALEWATRYPEIVDGTLVIAAAAALSALGIATHSEIGRRAIMADPDWNGGDYIEAGTFPTKGLSIARMAAMTTYHSRESLGSRFGRNSASRPMLYPAFGPTFDVEGYLHYHGEALVRRFDANSYLYLSRAMDLYDVTRNGGPEMWLRCITAPIRFVGISSDWLFTTDEIRALHDHLAWLGRDVAYSEIDSPNGHDAFLKDWNQLNPIVTSFLATVRPQESFEETFDTMCTEHGSPP